MASHVAVPIVKHPSDAGSPAAGWLLATVCTTRDDRGQVVHPKGQAKAPLDTSPLRSLPSGRETFGGNTPGIIATRADTAGGPAAKRSASAVIAKGRLPRPGRVQPAVVPSIGPRVRSAARASKVQVPLRANVGPAHALLEASVPAPRRSVTRTAGEGTPVGTPTVTQGACVVCHPPQSGGDSRCALRWRGTHRPTTRRSVRTSFAPQRGVACGVAHSTRSVARGRTRPEDEPPPLEGGCEWTPTQQMRADCIPSPPLPRQR